MPLPEPLPEPLQFSCPIKPGESLHGYLIRFMVVNKHDKIRYLAEHSGVRIPQIWYSAEELKRLRAMCNLDEGELESLAPGPVYSKGSDAVSRLLGHDIPESVFVRDLRRICPHCVARDGIHHAEWTLRVIRYCPEHCIELMAQCPECERMLDWHTPGIDRCLCGAQLMPRMAKASGPRIADMTFGMILSGAAAPLGPLLEGFDFTEVFFAVWQVAYVLDRGRKYMPDDGVDEYLSHWMDRGMVSLMIGGDLLTNAIAAKTGAGDRREAARAVKALGELCVRLHEMGPKASQLLEVVEPLWSSGKHALEAREV